MEQQCLGITRSGMRCKISGNLIDGYCHLHRKKVAVAEPAPPAVEPPRRPAAPVEPAPTQESALPAASSDKRNPLLIVAAFLLLFLLLVGGIRAAVFTRAISRQK